MHGSGRGTAGATASAVFSFEAPPGNSSQRSPQAMASQNHDPDQQHRQHLHRLESEPCGDCLGDRYTTGPEPEHDGALHDANVGPV